MQRWSYHEILPSSFFSITALYLSLHEASFTMPVILKYNIDFYYTHISLVDFDLQQSFCSFLSINSSASDAMACVRMTCRFPELIHKRLYPPPSIKWCLFHLLCNITCQSCSQHQIVDMLPLQLNKLVLHKSAV